MGLLKQLNQKYGAVPTHEMSFAYVEELRECLKNVDAQEVSSTESAQQFLRLLRKFREWLANTDRLKGDNYPQLLNSLLSVGEDGVYSSNLRFIFELIQNVDDCEFPAEEEHSLSVRFDFNKDTIVLNYNEKGFTPFNVFAITGIAEAAKNVSEGKNEIGEKGIGFKSVFGVADKVLIRSGWFSFELHKDNFTIPIANYQNTEYCKGTEMTLFVRSGQAWSIYEEIKKQYCNKDALFSKNPLLFLNKLTSLLIYNDAYRKMEFHVNRTDKTEAAKFFKDEDVLVSVDLHDHSKCADQHFVNEIKCVRYTSSVVFSKEACKARYGKQTKVGGTNGKMMSLQVIFPKPEYLDVVGKGALYSFLPTQLKLSVPVVCHVPFKLDASREFVDPQANNLWFTEACKYFSSLLDYAYQDWARTVKEYIVAYMPNVSKSLFVENDGKEKCLSSQFEFFGKHFASLPVFHTVKNNFVNIDHVFCFDSAEKIYDPERAYKLFPISRELFLLPEKAGMSNIGIPIQRGIYQKLFNIALKTPDKTKVILGYLEEAGFCPKEEHIPEDLHLLTQDQICFLLRYENITKLFVEAATKNLQKGKRPLYKVQTNSRMLIQQALYHEFKLTEAPKAVENYLKWCDAKCVLADIAPEQFFPCYDALVLSKNNPTSSFAAFCYAIDSRDTFSVRMKHREISERLNRLSESEEGSAEDYLRELRNNRMLGKEAMGYRQYQNFIDLILKSGTDHTRFIQELLQNADDCEYLQGVVPEFTLTLKNSRIVTTYNELGFTRGNIRSITAIGESTKNYLLNSGATGIGEKGVGFKTIFAVANSVQIHSGAYHFKLLAKAPTIPELITATESEKIVQGTKMEIELKNGVQLASYTEKALLELCLCLRKLRKIHINDIEITIEDFDDVRVITVNKKQYTFRRFIWNFTVDDSALRERENGLRNVSSHQSIVCYVPEKGAAKEYPLYCGLPTKHRIKVPLVIDAPFMLTTSREEIDEGSYLWNNRIRTEMYAAILKIMDELKCSERAGILRFVRFVPRRQGLTTVYVNDISNCEYLNKYGFLQELTAAEILPTFNRKVFVSARNAAARRYPAAVNYLFKQGCFADVSSGMALDIPRDEAYDSIMNALGCTEAPFAKAFSVIKRYAGQFIEEDTFREWLYSYLQSAPNEFQSQLREMPIIPVYPVFGEETEYVVWKNGAIFVKKDCAKSDNDYDVLNEKILPKAMCEQIFGVVINEMNAEWERQRYNDRLRTRLQGDDTVAIYNYLLAEYNKRSFEKYQSQELLMGMREQIPLKNQLGEMVRSKVFVCNEVTGYFQSELVLSIAVHDECKKLAQYLKYPDLSTIHYQDVPDVREVTADDIEDINTDYFENSEEIIRNFYRAGKLSDQLMADYGLEYIAMQFSQDDEYLEFPEHPVNNFDQLRKHVRRLLQNPIEIFAVKVERTIHKGRDSTGREFGLDDRDARKQTLQIYTPEGVHGRCFCQMCRKVKPYDLMEVNNIIATPKLYFPQTRVALCLECSKRFEAIRFSSAKKGKDGGEDLLLSAIRKATVGREGCVDVQIGKETIRFTATHLAEIQELLKSSLNASEASGIRR